MEDPYGFAIGTLFVLVYAVNRFNMPPTNRSSTTWLRYQSALALYVAASLILFVFLAQLVQLSPGVVELTLPEAARKVLDQWAETGAAAEGFSYFLFSALCLTILLPKAVGLRQVDAFIRTAFQKFGAIPYQANRLASDLRKAWFRLPSARREAFVADAAAYGLDAARLEAGPRSEVETAWLQAYALRASLQALAQDEPYAGFFDDFADRWRDLERRLERTIRRAVAVLRIESDADQKIAAPGVAEMVEAYRSDVMAELKEILGRARLFVARAVLSCERTHKARLQRIDEFGFQLEDASGVRINYDRMALLLVGLASLIALAALAAVHSVEGDPANLRHAIQITVVVWAAVLWAVLVKKTRFWRPAEPGAARPYLAYALAGLLAVLTQVVVYLVIKIMILDDPTTLLEHLPRTIPWVALVFFTSFLASYQCDDIPARGLALREALTQAVVTAFTAWIAFEIIQAYPALGPTGSDDHPLWAYAIGGGVIGLVIGWLVPSWYRADNQGAVENGELDPEIDLTVEPAF